MNNIDELLNQLEEAWLNSVPNCASPDQMVQTFMVPYPNSFRETARALLEPLLSPQWQPSATDKEELTQALAALGNKGSIKPIKPPKNKEELSGVQKLKEQICDAVEDCFELPPISEAWAVLLYRLDSILPPALFKRKPKAVEIQKDVWVMVDSIRTVSRTTLPHAHGNGVLEEIPALEILFTGDPEPRRFGLPLTGALEELLS